MFGGQAPHSLRGSSWPLPRLGLRCASLDSQAAPLQLLANKWAIRGPLALQVATPRRRVGEWRRVSELACTGSETSVLQCPMAVGDDVFCAPEESVLLTCAGHGDPVGKPAVP